jgi:lipopolysaccharide transport system ATP-binding protein
VLNNGELVFTGNQNEAVKYYQDNSSNFVVSKNFGKKIGNENILIQKFNVKPNKSDIISISSSVIFKLVFYNSQENINLDATFELKTIDEIVVFHHGKIITNENNSKKGTYTVTGIIPENILNAGIYSFNIIFGKNQSEILYMINDILQFEILNEALGSNLKLLPGIIRPNISYNVEFSDNE